MGGGGNKSEDEARVFGSRVLNPFKDIPMIVNMFFFARRQ